MFKRNVLVVIVLCFALMIPNILGNTYSVQAAPIVSANDSSIYLKQPWNSDTCTLYAVLMLFRRGALLNGRTDWDEFTEANYRGDWWTDSGMKWTVYAKGMHTESKAFDNNLSYNKLFFAQYLQKQPQGVVISYLGKSRWHTILLTRYDSNTDTFYCADPSPAVTSGEIPLIQSSLNGSSYTGYYTGKGSNNTQEEILAYVDRYWELWNDNSTNGTGFEGKSWSTGETSLPDVSDPDVYLKQASGSNTCTLVSLLNLFRRGTLLFEHNSSSTGYWNDFTEAKYKASWWNDNAGVTWNHSEQWLTSVFRTRSKGSDNKKFFADYLMREPQGVVIYYADSNSGRSHAVLLTKYIAATDTFYCVDPAPTVRGGEIPLTESLLNNKDYVGYNTGKSNNTQEDILYNIEYYCTLQIDTGTEEDTGFHRDDFLKKVYPYGNDIPSIPDKPINLKVSNINDTTAAVSWDASARATSYEVQSRCDSNDWMNETAYGSGTSFNTGKLTSAVYEYRVRAKNAGGVSEWSSIITYDNRKIPGKPVVKTDKLKYEFGNTALLSWNSTVNTNKYEVLLEKQSGDNWVAIKQWTVNTTNAAYEMHESGNWRAQIKAIGSDSFLATTSDYAYFSVGMKQSPTPTATPTPTLTPTPTATPTPKPTATATPTPTLRPEPTVIPTPMLTSTPIPTITPIPTDIPVLTPPSVLFEIDDKIALNIGKSKTIEPDILWENLSSDDLVWYSSDTSVATVSNDGTVKGINTGIVTITASTIDGSYSDTCEVTVSIPRPSIKKLKISKKNIKVTWKKITGIDGYQLAVSKSSDMSSSKYYTAKASDTSIKIKKLEKGITYYIRIRTYKKVDGNKINSEWSGIKKIKYTGK